ncbi:PcfJ domain-containing protein [Ottowia pentelensis]|uniref:PcfJ domain-containing protein n=1 Tax=Ottowia pentelensis TaxID=511108 RepID=UPI003643D86D
MAPAGAGQARQLKPWRAPFELTALQHDELELVWLGSAADILDEACAMRHCADSYVERCARGSYVLLSVRRKDTGKRLPRWACSGPMVACNCTR